LIVISGATSIKSGPHNLARRRIGKVENSALSVGKQRAMATTEFGSDLCGETAFARHDHVPAL